MADIRDVKVTIGVGFESLGLLDVKSFTPESTCGRWLRERCEVEALEALLREPGV
jgi:hypothetical protein